MTLYYFLLSIIICLSSILTGLLGIGGGILIIPLFLFLASFVSMDLSIHYIVGVSVQCILINSLIGLYYKRKLSFLPLSHILTYGLLTSAGTFLGSFIQNNTNDIIILILYILIFSISFFLTNKKNPSTKNLSDTQDTQDFLMGSYFSKSKITISSSLFFLTGVLSSIVGIGGAIFYLVILKYIYNKNIKELVPTSTLLVCISSFFMVIENFYLQKDLPGFLFPLIICSSIIGVSIGNYLYKKFSPKTLHILFNVIMCIALIRVVVSLISRI